MAKVKQWATEIAQNAVGCVINDYLKNKINSEDAKTKILKIENVNLAEVDENNVDDVLYFAKEDYNSKRGKEYHGGLKQ